MDSTTYFDFSPIYALATPYGKSAIAVFRTSGDSTFECLKKVFSNKKAFENVNTPKIKYGFIIDPESGEKVDEVVLSIYPEGHGYTKEETVEISTHGSLSVIKKMNDVLERAGFRKAEGGEFSFRAFRNGAITLTEAEAVLDIIESTTDRTRTLALKSRQGVLDKRIESIYEKLISLSSLLELQVDYSEDEYDEDISFPKKDIDSILIDLTYLKDNYKVSDVLKGGVNVALVGNTNAGKSTLFNALLKSNRSIVSDEKGTTRDFIKESIEIGGILVNLYDTAGLNENASGVEKIGIDRTIDIIENTDIILHLLPLDEIENGKIDSIKEYVKVNNKSPNAKTITILSKDDLPYNQNDKNIKQFLDNGAILYSAVTGDGLNKIIEAIKKATLELTATNKDNDTILISKTTENAVEKAYECISTLDEHTPIEASTNAVKDAIFEIGTILGKENPTEEILDSLFSRFCVGK